jgi:glycosyltransferase involved in cell wall biosynthesis
MPRVLLVHQPIDGGVARHVSDLAAGLAERGCEVTVCGPALPAREIPYGERVDHIRLDLPRVIAPGADAMALWGLARAVRDRRPDIVHAHSSKAGAVARLERALNFRTPLVYTPHLYSFASSFAGARERFAYREVERALAPLASRTVCVCEAEARLARMVGPAGRVRVVYNGVEPASTRSIDPRIAQLSQIGPVICAIAMLQRRKGIETLIDATPRVLAHHPSAQVAIWGDGPALGALRTQAAELGVIDAVHFLGLSTDPLAALRGAAVFVHPSRAEAFPYAILEAMSVGMPIVASDVGGVAEALVDGESGLLVAAGQREALAQALVDILGDADRRTSIGSAARSRFERHFTLQTMLDGLTSVYGEISPACRALARTPLGA